MTKRLAAIVMIGACAACAKKDSPTAQTQEIKPDKAFQDLLKRADAVTPKDAPDTQPADPSDASKEQVVVMPTPRPAPFYRPSATPYQRATRPSMPERTELQKMQELAQRTFAYRIQSVAQQNYSLENLRAQQRASCGGSQTITATGNTVYNPNATRSPTSATAGETYVVDNTASPQCRSLTGSLVTQEAAVRRQLDQIDVDAKALGIYPGIIRDMFSRYGISH